jgi:hypothetical protein
MTARTIRAQQLLSAPLERRILRQRELRRESKQESKDGDKRGKEHPAGFIASHAGAA